MHQLKSETGFITAELRFQENIKTIFSDFAMQMMLHEI
jgi:hypothetical protein